MNPDLRPRSLPEPGDSETDGAEPNKSKTRKRPSEFESEGVTGGEEIKSVARVGWVQRHCAYCG